jgi:hypothetical protein
MPVSPIIVTRRKLRANSLQPTLVDFCEPAASAANQQQELSVRLQSPSRKLSAIGTGLAAEILEFQRQGGRKNSG